MGLPLIRQARSQPQTVVQHEHAILRPSLFKSSAKVIRDETSPEERIKWQKAYDVLRADSADELLENRGIGDYSFVPKEQGGILGQGKFSAVYLALKGQQRYAVKHTPLHPHHEQISTRLLREAHILAQLPRHPNLVKAFETIRTPGHFYLVEEYLEGYVNLEDYAQSQPENSINGTIAQRFLDQLVAVVRDGLHSPIQIAHRDIKPENVLVHPHTEHLVLLDLGLSTHFSKSEAKLTTVCGSPAFWSPELWTSNYRQHTHCAEVLRYWGPEVDIWCIGVTMLRLLNGKRFPLGASHQSVDDIQQKVTKALENIADQALSARLAAFLFIDSKHRMTSFADYRLATAFRSDPNSEHAFKSTNYLPCETTHALLLPLITPDAQLNPLTPARTRSASRSRSRRASPDGKASKPSSRVPSRASSPIRVASLDKLVSLNPDHELEGLPPAPVQLAFGNPEAHSVKRAFSFFKYALRCAGIVYRVHSVTIPTPPPVKDLAAPAVYALLLHCVASLSNTASHAHQTLSTVLAARPPLERSQSARSTSMPPNKASEHKVRGLYLAFWLGISTATTEAVELSPVHQAPRIMRTEEGVQRRRHKSNGGRRSRATTPAAAESFIVHLSDRRVHDMVSDALSVGTYVDEETERGRSGGRPDRLAIQVDPLGLRIGQDDPLASPALPATKQLGRETGQKGFFDRFKRSQSVTHMREVAPEVDAALGAAV